MFPTRYFPDRYFAPRYWPKVGAEAVVNPDTSSLSGCVQVSPTLNGRIEVVPMLYGCARINPTLQGTVEVTP